MTHVKKEYVEVIAKFTEEGEITPMLIILNDVKYPVDRVLDVRRAVSLKAGGAGVRYKVRIAGVETHVFREDDRWFVEAKC